MKKTLIMALAALLALTLCACVNLNGDLGEALSQVDVNELYEQLHVEELVGQLGINEMIEQMIPQPEPVEAPELPEKAETDTEEMHFKTIGEAIDAADEVLGYGRWNPKVFVYVFIVDDVPYRLASMLDEDLQKKFDEADWIEDNKAREKAEMELAAALPVTSEEDLRIYYPSQEAMDSWIGKTGQELQDAGYEIYGYNVDDDGEYIEITKGMLFYRVETNEAFDIKNTDPSEEFLKMTIKGMRILRITSDAVDITVTE